MCLLREMADSRTGLQKVKSGTLYQKQALKKMKKCTEVSLTKRTH